MYKKDEKNLSLACPACLKFDKKLFGEKNNLEIFMCKNCSSVYTPRVNYEEADYDDLYHPDDIHTNIPDFVAERLDQIVSTFKSFRQNNRFLDIGCGAGSFLQAARRANWEVQGTEVSLSAVKLLHEQKMDVYHGILEEAKYPSDHFDIVVASYVIEHVPEPLEVIREVYRVLRPGGLFWLSIPQGRGISSRLLGTKWSQFGPPVHWCLFSRKGIKILLEKANFDKVKISAEGVDPFEILHVLRGKGDHKEIESSSTETTDNEKFEDVKSRRNIYEKVLSNPFSRLGKDSVNVGLSLTRLGDFLKVRSVKL